MELWDIIDLARRMGLTVTFGPGNIGGMRVAVLFRSGLVARAFEPVSTEEIDRPMVTRLLNDLIRELGKESPGP